MASNEFEAFLVRSYCEEACSSSFLLIGVMLQGGPKVTLDCTSKVTLRPPRNMTPIRRKEEERASS